MKIFNKLVNILFDEQEEEIPVITKNSAEKKDTKKDVIDGAKDEVIVTKVERPVASVKDDDLFDMPKFKEETEIDHETTKTFNFPAIDDDDFGVFEEKRTTKKSEKKEKREGSRFDFLSSTDYKKSDAYTKNRNNIYDASYKEEEDKDKKPFTLSPIISPVYGILNENYTKDDIVSVDNSQDRSNTKVDLDEVRKKAYGTLEDEISESLNKKIEDPKEIKDNNEENLLNTLSDDGISIDDLLGNEYKSDEEVFSSEEKNSDEDSIEPESDEAVIEDGDDDLFDLIDSIYSGKDSEWWVLFLWRTYQFVFIFY